MLTEHFLRNRRGVSLSGSERAILEDAVAEVIISETRKTVVRAGEPIGMSTLLVEGFMSRHIDDRRGLRQLVTVHVPGEFVDLHAFPMGTLDHSVGTLTPVKFALVPHEALRVIMAENPELARKLWFSTLLDASMHRAWIFRLGRLDAVGRVAHFLSEMNARLEAIGLSDGRNFSLGITQVDLAEACGLTSVHVNRVMRQLREMDLCIFRSSKVEILDRGGLERRGNFDAAYLYLENYPTSASRRNEFYNIGPQ